VLQWRTLIVTPIHNNPMDVGVVRVLINKELIYYDIIIIIIIIIKWIIAVSALSFYNFVITLWELSR